jgi:hypothetical protein
VNQFDRYHYRPYASIDRSMSTNGYANSSSSNQNETAIVRDEFYPRKYPPVTSNETHHQYNYQSTTNQDADKWHDNAISINQGKTKHSSSLVATSNTIVIAI